MGMPKMISFNRTLRFLALVATFSAAIAMGTSHERVSLFGLQFEAKYSNTPSFKYFVIANVIGCIYSFAALFVPSEELIGALMVALDVAFTMLLTSSISAAVAIAQVGKQGNQSAGWLPVCNQVPNYCQRVTISLIAGFIGVVIYMLILLYSIYLVFRKTTCS